ncbi:MAG: hypothetical protein R3D32_10420 [Nitratireductor sp.]
MNDSRIIKLLLAVVVFAFIHTNEANASEELTLSQFKQEVADLRAENKRIEKLGCFPKNGKTYFQIERTVKMFGPKKDWQWAVGASLSNKNIEMTKKGYVRTSLSTVMGKGVKLQCAVWLRK